MSAPAVSQPNRSSDRLPDRYHPDDETLAQYTSISRLAVLSLFLGLASALMLASPIAVLVPLAGIATAVIALRSIAGSNGQLTGRWPAIVGLCLATLFLGWGISRPWTRQNHIRNTAQKLADHWLELVRSGKLQQADQLMRPPSERFSDDSAMADYYKQNNEAGEQLREIFGREPLTSFTAMGPKGSYRLKGIAVQRPRGPSDEIVFEYVYGENLGTPAEKSMWIYVMRGADGLGGVPAWRLERADNLPPPDGY